VSDKLIIPFNDGIKIEDLFLEAELVKSKGEARRLAKQNGLKLNWTDNPVDPDMIVGPEWIQVILFRGKKQIKFVVNKDKISLAKKLDIIH
jgi:tyrosyl-tRNA synthetase